jgi:hypothetical protein
MLCASIYVNGQITNSLNSPRVNDKLNGHSCELTLSHKLGKDVIWDFSDIGVEGKTTNLNFFRYENSTDTILRISHGERQYLYINNDTLKVLGTENITQKIMYDVPIKKIAYPMGYGDSINGYFYGRGRCYDRYAIRTIGKYKTKVDASGKIILPSGETLSHVLKQTTTKVYYNQYYQIDSISLPREDFSEKEIEKLLGQDSTSVVEEEILWYAKGYRYPIIESIKTYAQYDKSNCNSKSYYYSTYTQQILPIDDENLEIRNMYDTQENDKDANLSSQISKEQNFRYDFNLDKSLRNVTVIASADMPIDLEVILANVSGMVYKTIQKKDIEETEIELDYSNLPRGQYAVYIKVGLEIYTEKFDN